MIPAVNWTRFLSDDEVAVRTIISEKYPLCLPDLCVFHINKNIVKKMGTLKLTSFFKNCKGDEEVYVYKFLRLIFAIPFLPETHIKSGLLFLKSKIDQFIKVHCKEWQVQKFQEFFNYLTEYVYGSPERINLICKFKEETRTTNKVESAHAAINKSKFLSKKNQSLGRVVSGKIVRCVLKLINIICIYISRIIGVGLPNQSGLFNPFKKGSRCNSETAKEIFGKRGGYCTNIYEI